MSEVYLRSVASCIPDNIYTNDDLCEVLRLDKAKAEKYGKLLGVHSRPISVDYRNGGKQIISGEDLAYGAARSACARAQMLPHDIDTLICCSSFFDYIAPPLSSRLLKRLQIDRAVTFDLIGGCAELLHGLSLAANMIRLGQATNILIASSEVINAWWAQTRYPIEHFIFGDTGGALILSGETGSHRLRAITLETRSKVGGEPAELICMPIIGGKATMKPFYTAAKVDPACAALSDVPSVYRLVHNIKQVALAAPQAMIASTQHLLHVEHVSPEGVFLIPHQASIGVLSALQATGIPEAQIGISLPTRGNMSTSSLPVTLSEHWESACIQPSLALTSVGVGMSYGAALFDRV